MSHSPYEYETRTFGSEDNIKSLNISGNLYVQGQIYKGGVNDPEKVDFLDRFISIIDKMTLHIENLQKKVLDIEEKITELYYSPGMPGYLESEQEFCKLKKN